MKNIYFFDWNYVLVTILLTTVVPWRCGKAWKTNWPICPASARGSGSGFICTVGRIFSSPAYLHHAFIDAHILPISRKVSLDFSSLCLPKINNWKRLLFWATRFYVRIPSTALAVADVVQPNRKLECRAYRSLSTIEIPPHVVCAKVRKRLWKLQLTVTVDNCLSSP